MTRIRFDGLYCRIESSVERLSIKIVQIDNNSGTKLFTLNNQPEIIGFPALHLNFKPNSFYQRHAAVESSFQYCMKSNDCQQLWKFKINLFKYHGMQYANQNSCHLNAALQTIPNLADQSCVNRSRSALLSCVCMHIFSVM